MAAVRLIEPRLVTDAPVVTDSVNRRQVGGEHYKKYGHMQPWDVVAHFNMDYFQGVIFKYIVRWKDKGKIEDLEKARHFLDKYIEVEKARIRNNERDHTCENPFTL